MLSRFILSDVTVSEPRLDRVVSMGESHTKRAFNSQYISKTSEPNSDGIRHILFIDNFTKSYSYEHVCIMFLLWQRRLNELLIIIWP